MTGRFAWLTVCLVAGTVVTMLLIGLAFLPVSDWEVFVPAAALAGGAMVLLAATAVEIMGRRLAQPLRRMVRSIDAGEVGQATLGEFAQQAPVEVAPLLYALQRAQSGQRGALEQLERDRGQIAALFEHLADGVLVLDPDERIVLSNPAAARLLGRTLASGHALSEAVRDAELVELVRAAPSGESAVHLIDMPNGQSGRRGWLQVIATRFPDAARRLVVLQDVTELRRTEAARREFVANVSHELRTPVAALKALVETLEGGAMDDPEVGPDFLRRMHVEVDGLAQLVTELLELARVEAGKLDLEVAPCEAGELVREAVERARPYAETLGLHVEVVQQPAADVVVEADARRIGQVLTNLLANAVKFSVRGGRIETGARVVDDQVEFWVADTGVGIEFEQLSRVFERFYKTDASRTGAGTGLGRAIWKHI